VIYDVEVCGFLAGVILRSPRWAEIENLILPIYNNTTDRELRRRTVCETTAEKSLRFEYPLFQKNKKDIINSLPEDLLKYCWYCRSPEDGLPCGKCHSCKDMI
jgi:hypothetical protein